jgi:hypothetical protein
MHAVRNKIPIDADNKAHGWNYRPSVWRLANKHDSAMLCGECDTKQRIVVIVVIDPPL